MQQWIYVLKPTRLEMLTEGSTPEEDETVSRHFAYLKDGSPVFSGMGRCFFPSETVEP